MQLRDKHSKIFNLKIIFILCFNNIFNTFQSAIEHIIAHNEAENLRNLIKKYNNLKTLLIKKVKIFFK